ncbi:hypothetical protein J4474_03725 [Candidatus Pacearchaeota archaeon]|nr:hypothetical protein [Candidatus Pacearchaeota archaeon]
MIKQKIIQNINLMHSGERGGMYSLFKEESWGANGSFYKDVHFPCMVANYLYRGETGEIVKFTMEDEVTAEERKLYSEGSFQIAIDMMGERDYAIVGMRLKEGTNEIGRKTLEESVQMFNNLHEKFPLPTENED